MVVIKKCFSVTVHTKSSLSNNQPRQAGTGCFGRMEIDQLWISADSDLAFTFLIGSSLTMLYEEVKWGRRRS